MRDNQDLLETLRRIDGRNYKAYKELRGAYRFPGYGLWVDHVQGDPFAAPSRVRVQVDSRTTDFPARLLETGGRQLGLRDFLVRRLARAVRRVCRGDRGLGRSGEVCVDEPGQVVLPRTAVLLKDGGVEARLTLGLPARGRTVLGGQARAMFFEELPELVASLLHLDPDEAEAFVACVEDQEALRAQLPGRGLVAFVANGSVLPRRSGVDDRPLPDAVPFTSPAELEVELPLPNAGCVRGLGLPEGVTLIVGGGFHGKSTLLDALSRGVYDHAPGDGRERVACVPWAVKIRAEDGRRVEAVDISGFVDRLPYGRDTVRFCTDNASGSTSQAANIVEALELGARLLLIDEDTSASNLMLRDARMQALVPREKEPITPLLDRVRELYQDHGVSTVLVMGGSGDYFEVADRVVALEDYRPRDVTSAAREVARRVPSSRRPQARGRFPEPGARRRPARESFDASRAGREVRIDVRGLHRLVFGRTEVELAALEQLVDRSQTRAIGWMLHHYGRRYAEAYPDLRAGLEALMEEVERHGLDRVTPFELGDLALPRLFELGAALNRLRTLRVR